MTTLMLFLFYLWSYFCWFCFCRWPDEAISNNYSHSRWNNWWTDRLSACLTDWPISTDMTISFYLLTSLPVLWRIHISLYWRLVFATDSAEFSSDNLLTRWVVHIHFGHNISMTIKKTDSYLSFHVLWLLANICKLSICSCVARYYLFNWLNILFVLIPFFIEHIYYNYYIWIYIIFLKILISI